MSEEALSILAGSRSGDGLRAFAWYDGQLVGPETGLPVSDWGLNYDDRQVQGQFTASIDDPDGALAPWAVDDPLGVGGPRLQVIYTLPLGYTVDIGWFRLATNAPVESWRVYRLGEHGDDLRFVSGGGRVPITADDLTRLVVRDRFIAPDSPRAGATVLSEVRRLLRDIMPVSVAPGVTDAAVPRTLVYERERMDAVEDLLARIDCGHRMSNDGQLEVYPLAKTDPVWQVVGGDEGVLISVQREQSIDGLHNGWVVEGQDEEGRQLIGRAFEEAGPLRWDGPHGHDPYFQASTGLLKTQTAVDTAARTLRANQRAARSVDLVVECLPHPGLQIGDWVLVANPVVAGDPVPLIGRVTAIRMRGSAGGGVSPMTITVACGYAEVQAVARAVSRAA
ncbi:hypothetical protein [Cellulosimicrobium sp. TH-20]|uniref:hypothetical protein n=1 Tax=Cellulosimicrobium sp. TH-20 TaxID=1980001 RepID=UPI001583ABCA